MSGDGGGKGGPVKKASIVIDVIVEAIFIIGKQIQMFGNAALQGCVNTLQESHNPVHVFTSATLTFSSVTTERKSVLTS